MASGHPAASSKRVYDIGTGDVVTTSALCAVIPKDTGDLNAASGSSVIKLVEYLRAPSGPVITCAIAELSPNSRLGKKVDQGEGAFVRSLLTAGSRWGSTMPEAKLASGRLLYNWHRYYDPKLGRYVTSDPIGLAGGMNPYLYVRANPLRYVDPMGLKELSVGGEASAHGVLVGLGVGAGVTIDDNGTICVYGSGSLTFGLGIFAGAGYNVSGSTGTNSTGLSGSGGLFLEGGGGIAAGTEVNVGSGGTVGGGKGFGGVGVGGAGGYRETGKATYCFNEPEDDKGCKK